MPALLERPKLSNAMARALHKHIMKEREKKRQEDEEVQKMGGKLQVLQEEKHQLFLQLKKVLHEEEKRRRKDQPGFPPGSSEHGQFSSSTAVHEPFAVTQAQHHTSYGPAASVPISFAGTTQIRGASPFQSMPFLPQGYAVHSHFTTQPGFIPSASISLQKQLEHANQRSGFTDSAALRPIHPQALHVSATDVFFPNSSPNIHLRHNRLCLREYLNTVFLSICIYLSGSRSRKRLYARASDDSQREKRAEKRYSSQKTYK
uniref:G protein pathway suppressor 2 n=1 Tax=Sinocyclocheilus anshuiensis TaxID=1608454 RepID=A0A671KD15_9TELE